MITISIDDSQIQKALAGLQRKMQDMTPLMRSVGEYLTETTKRRFATGASPDGTLWAPNRPVTIARYLGRYKSSFTKTGKLSKTGAKRAGAKKPLTGETKALGTTIHYQAGRLQVSIGSALEYSAVQQFGAKKGAFGRTRRGAPIPWGDIPPRPFLGLSGDDEGAIMEKINDYLTGGR